MKIEREVRDGRCKYEVWNDYRTHVIGAATIDRNSEPKELENINVHPGRRGDGVGSRLLSRILSDYDDSTIVAWVFNQRLEWYERHGFDAVENSEDLVKVKRPPR